MIDLITGADVARRLGYSREYVRQLLERGDVLPAPLGRLGNYVVWNAPEFDEWAREQQPLLETKSDGVAFKTIPGRPGVLDVDEGDGKQRSAVAWINAKLVELKPYPKHGALVRAESGETGRILKNMKGNWTLHPAE